MQVIGVYRHAGRIGQRAETVRAHEVLERHEASSGTRSDVTQQALHRLLRPVLAPREFRRFAVRVRQRGELCLDGLSFLAGQRLPGLDECQRQMSARQLSEAQIGVVEVRIRRRPENDDIGAAARRFRNVGL
jgi:hypothetical protein